MMTGSPAAGETRRRRRRSPRLNQGGYLGDEMLEGDRLERGGDIRQPDGSRRDHGDTTMILVEDVVGPRPRPHRTSPFQHLQASGPQTPKSHIVSVLMPGLG